MKLEIIDDDNYNNNCYNYYGKMRSCCFFMLMLFLELERKKYSVHGLVLCERARTPISTRRGGMSEKEQLCQQKQIRGFIKQ